MNYFDPYRQELQLVFSEAKQRIANFPEPFNEAGLAYLRKFDVFERESSKNYICYLLPYWINESASIPIVQCRMLSLSNVFSMLYYFLQDDVMDETPAAWKEQLALAHLCHFEMEAILRELFAANSPFWGYRQHYMNEWASAVVHEDKHDYFMTDIVQVAKKASPLKLASTGVLLLADQPEKIADVEELVDYSLVLLQMADDLTDWEDDLSEGNYNCLLSMIHAKRQSDHPLQAEEAESYIYDRSLMTEYCDRSKEVLDILNNSQIGISTLLSFSHFTYEGIAGFTNRVENKRRTLLSGGFDYILSNFQKK
ncbi:hypothetical protein [Paenibacillus sp. JDR-2]|uniref:hypothetical protein n=1 Tax=Paenibacillus sp. (strain JDR-2) TaxID=324057 RepID=UPI0001664DAA|nr:hypothetical protein [Paenibacillus sp. JDR-2]ACS99670.1 hypothetical protein Pjdr2_0991 [Paenibacillus sp. JDR-2]